MTRFANIALVAFGAVKGANAWGALGHATVAYIAQNYVTSETASWYALLHSCQNYQSAPDGIEQFFLVLNTNK